MGRSPGSLVIRQINTDDRDEMEEFQRVYVAAERAEFADAAVYTLGDAIAMLTRPSAGMIYRGYGAFAADRMVGEGMLIASTTDNLRRARLLAWVAPPDRRRGVGSAVADYLTREARGLGRDILIASAIYPFDRRADHPYRRFAEHLGFRLANTQIERRLTLPVADTLLDDLASASAPHHTAYEIQTIVGPIPTGLAQGYCDVINRLQLDAPPGDLQVEKGRHMPATIADQDAELVAQGRTRVTALALNRAGRVVALSSSSVTMSGEPGVDQWATIVRPTDRGHRLGMAVKVAQIRVIQQTFPEKQFISTTNAETNRQMIDINEALGFRRRALEGEFQRFLGPAPGARP